MTKKKFDIGRLYKNKVKKSNCFICKGLILPEEIIYEDNKIIAFLDKYPPTKGYTLIATKKHYEDISEISKSEYQKIQKHLYKIAIAIKKSFNPNKICILNSGDILKHFHFHIIPIYRKSMHNHFIDIILKKHILNMSQKERKEIADKIKENL